MRYVIADPSKPIEIGYERDAKTMNVHFNVSDFIKDYPGCTCHLSYIRPTVTQPYEPENTRIIGSELVWNVSAADAEFSGYGSVQIVMFRNSDQVAHSPEMTVHVNESHDSTAEPPEEPIQAWFVRVMAAQDEAKDLAEKVLSMTVEVETLPAGSEATAEYDAETGVMHFGIPAGEDGAPGPYGPPGDDGFSPEVTIQTISGGHSVKITDEEHPEGQTFNVMDGAKGDSGFSPVVTVTEIEGGHSVKITDEVHPTGQTFNVMDGVDGQDGQDGADGVDGVSPAVEIEDIMGGHSVTITDKDHPSGQTFEVMDGVDGEVPIDDTTPAADKVYSSQKVASEVSQLNQAILNLDTFKADKVALKEANRRIHLLEEAALGHLYTDESVTETSYQQTVPSGSLSNAVLGMWGGHSEVVEGEIVSADVDDIQTLGKNLLAKPCGYSNTPVGLTECFYLDAGEYTMSIKNVSAQNWRFLISTFEENGDNAQTGMITAVTLNERTSSENIYYLSGGNGVSETCKFTLNRNGFIHINLAYGTDCSATSFTNAMLEKGSTRTSFKPYKLTNNPIPSSVLAQYPLRSAGSAYDTITYEPTTVDGVTIPKWKHHNRIGTVDLGMFTWSYSNITDHERFLASFQDVKQVADNVVANLLSARYNADTADNTHRHSTDKIIGVITNKRFAVYDSQYTDVASFSSAISGVTLYYELDNEVVTDITDLMQNWDGVLEVEEGGTVTFRQVGDTIFAIPNTVNYLVKTTQGGA